MSGSEQSNSFYIKKYSLLFEERDRVKVEHDKGNADLASHLSEFRKKLDAEESDQIKRFDDEFFSGGSKDNSIQAAEDINNATENAIKENIDKLSKNKKSHPSWIKKVYKQIVFSTHPDKIGSFPIKAVVEKYTRLYQVTIEAYEKGQYADVLMVAGELEISVPNNKIFEYIIPAMTVTSNEISDITKLIGYHWYHVSEDEREIMLTNYLKQLGYIFTTEQVKDIVKRKSNRKVGQRPVKIARNR